MEGGEGVGTAVALSMMISDFLVDELGPDEEQSRSDIKRRCRTLVSNFIPHLDALGDSMLASMAERAELRALPAANTTTPVAAGQAAPSTTQNGKKRPADSTAAKPSKKKKKKSTDVPKGGFAFGLRYPPADEYVRPANAGAGAVANGSARAVTPAPAALASVRTAATDSTPAGTANPKAGTANDAKAKARSSGGAAKTDAAATPQLSKRKLFQITVAAATGYVLRKLDSAVLEQLPQSLHDSVHMYKKTLKEKDWQAFRTDVEAIVEKVFPEANASTENIRDNPRHQVVDLLVKRDEEAGDEMHPTLKGFLAWAQQSAAEQAADPAGFKANAAGNAAAGATPKVERKTDMLDAAGPSTTTPCAGGPAGGGKAKQSKKRDDAAAHTTPAAQITSLGNKAGVTGTKGAQDEGKGTQAAAKTPAAGEQKRKGGKAARAVAADHAGVKADGKGALKQDGKVGVKKEAKVAALAKQESSEEESSSEEHVEDDGAADTDMSEDEDVPAADDTQGDEEEEEDEDGEEEEDGEESSDFDGLDED